MEMMTHSAMQEYMTNSTLQDYGSPPTETPVSMDGCLPSFTTRQTGSGTWG